MWLQEEEIKEEHEEDVLFVEFQRLVSHTRTKNNGYPKTIKVMTAIKLACVLRHLMKLISRYPLIDRSA